MDEDVDSIKVESVTGGNDWNKSAHIPDDLYNVEITNLRKTERPNYNTGEAETAVEFEFDVKDGDVKGAKLYSLVSPKIGKDGEKPSNLWKIIVATLGPDTDTDNDFHLSTLKGQSLRVMVKEKKSKKTGEPYSAVVEYSKKK